MKLAEAVGLDREQVLSQELVLPGVRFAVDAYVNKPVNLAKFLDVIRKLRQHWLDDVIVPLVD